MRASTGLIALAAFFWPIFLAGPPAQADELDLSTIKCKAFFESSKDRVSFILAWVNGYYKNDDDPAVIDFDELKKNFDDIKTYCAAHPDTSVADAAEELFNKSSDK